MQRDIGRVVSCGYFSFPLFFREKNFALNLNPDQWRLFDVRKMSSKEGRNDNFGGLGASLISGAPSSIFVFIFTYLWIRIREYGVPFYSLIKKKKGSKRNNAKETSGDGPANKKPKLNSATTDFSSIDFTKCDKNTEDGKEYNFKISSWNVAGIRACVKKGFADYVKHENADIYCFQETKCTDDKLPSEVKIPGYQRYFLSGEKAGYAGVALYSKEKPIEVKYGMGNKEYDKEGRVITAEYEKFYFITTYVVNAGQGLCNLKKRMQWDVEFKEYINNLDSKKPIILAGDLNVAHNPIDLANPQTNTKSAGFTKEERDDFTELLKCGYVDSFRKLYPEKKGAYSYWTYLGNARSRNTGWRLDYFVISERLMPHVCDNVMRTEVYGSDHCPIVLFLNI